MKVSVVITTYNQVDILELSLAALIPQLKKVEGEILVCDDGSSQNTLAVVERFSKEFSAIRYVWQQDRNFRAGQIRNCGIDLAEGKIVVIIDGDIIPGKNFIKEHLDFHKKNPKSLFGGGRDFVHDKDLEKILKSSKKRQRLSKELDSVSWRNKEEEMYRSRWLRSAHKWKAVFSYNLSFPKSAKIFFNEELVGWGIEDWEFCYQFYKKGYNTSYQSNMAKVYHIDLKDRINNSFRNNNHQQLVDFARNLLIFLDKSRDTSLDSCAVALCNYRLDTRTNKWSFKDYDHIRGYKAGILLLRRWLAREDFYIKPWPHRKRRVQHDISVVVSRFNQEHMDKPFCFSLKQQKDAPDFEVVVCDDGSSSKILQIAKKLYNRAPYSVRYIWQADIGLRVTRSRNSGLKISQSDLVLLLDGDIIPSKSLVSQHYNFLKNRSKTVLVGTRRLINEVSFTAIPLNRSFFSMLHNKSKYFQSEEEFRDYLTTETKDAHPWRLSITCNLSGPRKDMGFDENMITWGHEDLEMGYRLWQKGYKFEYHSDIIGYHVGMKRGWYLDMEDVSAQKLLETAEGGLYIISKYPNEKFMAVLADVLRYFRMNTAGEWYFSWKRKSLSKGVSDFLNWRDKNPEKTIYRSIIYPLWLKKLRR
jgi:glycosyltransferase involved in cell wall biosynthesis